MTHEIRILGQDNNGYGYNAGYGGLSYSVLFCIFSRLESAGCDIPSIRAAIV